MKRKRIEIWRALFETRPRQMKQIQKKKKDERRDIKFNRYA